MAGDNSELGQDSARYAQSSAVDDKELERMLEAGELPEDMHELEARLGADSDDKGQYADDQKPDGADASTRDDTSKQGDTAAGDDDPQSQEDGEKPDPGEQAAKTDAEDETGTPAGEEEEGAQQAKADDAKAQGDDKDGAGDTDPQQTPDGVLTRDGKHVIPYGVLERARASERDAKQENEQLKQQLDELRRQQAAGNQAQTQTQERRADAQAQQDQVLAQYGLDRQDLPFRQDGSLDVDKLRDEYPEEVVNVLSATNQMIQTLNQRVDELQRDRDAQLEREQNLMRQSVQDAIDATPALAELQAEGGRRWHYAKGVDEDLQGDPEWANQPMRLRFAEVAHIVGGGRPRSPDEVQAALDGQQQQPSQTEHKPSQPGDPRERADQRVREQAGQRQVPPTHSDMPAGQRPAQSGLEHLEGADPIQLEKAFENAQDPDALLSKLLS